MTKTTTPQSDANQPSMTRPPVVVILGHVDHGKTSILDKIRTSKIADKEAGGITQHIGAYQVEQDGKKITFLDTPGHEAFTAIRSRGANVADIAILVVAADEGVKPQTIEAIKIIQATKMPYIVALNKIDKEGANPMRIRQELAEKEVLVEGYGGTVPIVELSAKTGAGIDSLLEMIGLVAELEELITSPSNIARGVIVECHKDDRRGLLATTLVQDGTLHVGDWISAGTAYGKVKLLENFLGKATKNAVASEPCVILGWETTPALGQAFHVVATRDEAEREALIAAQIAPQALFTYEQSPEQKRSGQRILNLIIKADVNSSLEAIDHALKTIRSDEVAFRVIHFGVGDITTSDMQSARTMSATVVGFHVAVEDSARTIADRENIYVNTFTIIYELIETIRDRMSDLLDPEIRRTPLGKVKVLALFKSGDKSQIIGGKITQGKAVRGAMIDVIHNGTIIMTGRLGQLQHNKADVPEVAEGLETGMRFDQIKTEAKPTVPGKPVRQGANAIVIGDVLDIYEEEKIKRSL